MHSPLSMLEVALAAAIAFGSLFWLVTCASAVAFRKERSAASKAPRCLPPATLLKPVCGLEKNLAANLRTACIQDYPEYQVVFSVQSAADPAIPILRELEREFGSRRVTVAVETVQIGLNGKVNNLAGAIRHAR